MRLLLLPTVGFILIYSLLPHKELRFIIYTFPVLSLVAARGCSFILCNYQKSWIYKLGSAVVVGQLLTNAAFSSISLYVSHHNYPGGRGMQELHRLLPVTADVFVHIDTYAAETGVSRFLEQNRTWRYDKREDLNCTNPDIKMYSHLLMEANVTKIQLLQDTHQPLAFIEGYSNIAFDAFHFPPVSVRLERKTVIMERKIATGQQKDFIKQQVYLSVEDVNEWYHLSQSGSAVAHLPAGNFERFQCIADRQHHLPLIAADHFPEIALDRHLVDGFLLFHQPLQHEKGGPPFGRNILNELVLGQLVHPLELSQLLLGLCRAMHTFTDLSCNTQKVLNHSLALYGFANNEVYSVSKTLHGDMAMVLQDTRCEVDNTTFSLFQVGQHNVLHPFVHVWYGSTEAQVDECGTAVKAAEEVDGEVFFEAEEMTLLVKSPFFGEFGDGGIKDEARELVRLFEDASAPSCKSTVGFTDRILTLVRHLFLPIHGSSPR
ncbi:hypothetical protein FQN60_005568, partial [Etheostoma spectabile]